jgi:hypothetical protein
LPLQIFPFFLLQFARIKNSVERKSQKADSNVIKFQKEEERTSEAHQWRLMKVDFVGFPRKKLYKENNLMSLIYFAVERFELNGMEKFCSQIVRSSVSFLFFFVSTSFISFISRKKEKS